MKFGYLFFGICISILSACDEESVSLSDNSIVIEGYLVAGEPVEHIKISKMIMFNQEEEVTNPAINDAEVFIRWNEEDFLLSLLEPDSGVYGYPGPELQVIAGQTYEIFVEYFDNIVSAITTVPEKPAGLTVDRPTMVVESFTSFQEVRTRYMEDVEIIWENDDQSYYYVHIENIDSNPGYVDIFGILEDSPRGSFTRITTPTQLDFHVLQGRIITRYGTHRIRLYKVQQEYADLYETSEQDSRSLNEPLSNVDNGYGIFTSFNYEDIFIEVEDY